MAGIYLHIPFCKKACNYCDFHFSTQFEKTDEVVLAMIKELELRKNELNDERIETIYFGGGTPSVLSTDQIKQLTETIYKNYNADLIQEFTFEANPDDLTFQKIKELIRIGVNRLSIGVQSFLNDELVWMNRSHNAEQSVEFIKNTQDAGIENISIDLIYGSKFQTLTNWENTLQQTFSLNVPHISAYNLTIEEKTSLGRLNKKGIEPDINDSFSSSCFDLLMQKTSEEGYLHYEISNFARIGKLAIHNSNYWRGEKYIGIGPSAHSFDGMDRKWNIKKNHLYIKSLTENKIPSTIEKLSLNNKYNEYILTGLRTSWGVNTKHIEEKFGKTFMIFFNNEMNKHIKKGWCVCKEDCFTLTTSGKHYADKIASDLFMV